MAPHQERRYRDRPAGRQSYSTRRGRGAGRIDTAEGRIRAYHDSSEFGFCVVLQFRRTEYGTRAELLAVVRQRAASPLRAPVRGEIRRELADRLISRPGGWLASCGENSATIPNDARCP